MTSVIETGTTPPSEATQRIERNITELMEIDDVYEAKARQFLADAAGELAKLGFPTRKMVRNFDPEQRQIDVPLFGFHKKTVVGRESNYQVEYFLNPKGEIIPYSPPSPVLREEYLGTAGVFDYRELTRAALGEVEREITRLQSKPQNQRA